jgi:hypothetical protein
MKCFDDTIKENLSVMATKSECAPLIWNKFTPKQKEVWQQLYRAFLEPMNFHKDWGCKCNRVKQSVTAHNMACEGVLTLNHIGMLPGKATVKKEK